MILKFKNTDLYYTKSGEGPTVVLLHGFLETTQMWKALIPELSKQHQVFAIDLLGHGQTGCIGYVHSMEDMAEAVFAVLNHHNINKAIVIGHSMGGYVALAMAEQQPELFKGLCLMNSTFEADDKERKRIRTRANKMAKTSYESLIRLSFANLFAPESREIFKKEYEAALELALTTPVQGYIAAQEGMKLRPNRFEILKHLKTKKLIIIGEKDSIIDGGKLINTIKDTTIAYIKFSEGHMSHIENKYELSYTIKHFIEK
jgi:pimeloyl-ACP methyl ester carboxylesterase